MTPTIRAVTFDFYLTLVYHRAGQGRGAALMEYLRGQALESEAWEHQVLYDIFEHHAVDYSPDLSEDGRQRYFRQLAKRLFLLCFLLNASLPQQIPQQYSVASSWNSWLKSAAVRSALSTNSSPRTALRCLKPAS